MLQSAHGVKTGYGRTLLPGLEPPTHWFDAQEADRDSEALVDAYRDDLHKFLDRDEDTWRPEFVEIKVEQLENR
jgi:hypothetical protein